MGRGNLLLGIDVDGVLRNTYIGIAKAYLLSGGIKEYKLSDFKEYDFTKTMDVTNKEGFFRTYADTIFLHSKKMPNTDYIYKLKDYGKIQIITSQFKGLEHLTLEWLDNNDIPYDEIHFTWDKQNVKTNILLDDFPYNLNNMPRYVLKVCYDAPYNKEFKGHRVKDMKHFTHFIEDLITKGEKYYDK